MNIGVDLDGVVCDFVHSFIPVVEQKYGVRLNPQQIYVHDLFLVLGVPSDHILSLVHETLKVDLQLVSGAREGLEHLRKTHRVSLVTTRPLSTIDSTREWLSRHNVPHDELLFLGEGNKHVSCQHIDIFVDDHLREILGFHGKTQNLIVFDRPWNQSLNVLGLFKRARNWADVIDIVDSLS